MRGRRLTVFVLVGAALLAALVLIVIAVTRAPGPPTAYGLATPGGNQGVSEPVATCRVARVPCPRGELELASPYATQAFAAFHKQILDPGGYVRLWIPYDALYTWTGGRHGCGWSPYAFGRPARFNSLNGIEAFDRLVWNIQGVRALGLRPEVVFSAGSGEGAPAYPDPTTTQPPVRLTPAGRDYYCGVLGVIGWLRSDLGSRAPTHWEAFNEPDSYRPYQGSHGPLEAAELWQLANSAAQQVGSEQVAALTVTDPEGGYAGYYIEVLTNPANCPSGLEPFPIKCEFPRYWAVHDYDDPTAGGTADLRAFESTLSRLAGQRDPPLEVWVTESAVEPGSQTRSDLNRTGCAGTEPDNASTLGACVDGDASAQRRGAQAWRSLLSVSAPGVSTTQVYWFEFQLIHSWDSALTDASGRPRPSLCALVTGTVCDGDPDDYLLDAPRSR